MLSVGRAGRGRPEEEEEGDESEEGYERGGEAVGEERVGRGARVSRPRWEGGKEWPEEEGVEVDRAYSPSKAGLRGP